MGRKSSIKVGTRLGKLEIIGIRTFSLGIRSAAICRCDCGTVKDVKAIYLKKVKSCGCSQHEKESRKPRGQEDYWKKEYGTAAMNSFFSGYRAKARRHGNEFSITKDEFVALVSKNCAYCGAPPAERMPYRKDGKPMYNGPAYASGIDRVDNDLGYTIGNSLPCCSECNISKHTRSKDQFEDHALRVAAHYLQTRLDPSTQREHRLIAQQVLEVLRGVAPVTMSAFFPEGV